MKKMKFLFALAVTLILGGNLVAQTVQAGFTYTQGTLPGQIIFTDITTNYPSSPGVYSGTIQSGILNGVYNSGPHNGYGIIQNQGGSKSIFYSYNGTYLVNYQVFSSTPGNYSVFTDTIVINTIPTNLPCSAAINITQGSVPGSIDISDNSIGEDYGIFKSYGASPTSTTLNQSSPSATIQYNNNSAGYNYVYHIADTITGCYDSISDVISITNLPCQAQAALSVNPINVFGDYSFSDNSINSTGGNLSFIDGTLQNYYIAPNGTISHTFSTPGTYPYQYVANHSSGCSDTLLDTLIISTINPPCNFTGGLTITPGANPGDYIFTDNSSSALSYSSLYLTYGTNSTGLTNITSDTVNIPLNGTLNYVYFVQNASALCTDTIYGTYSLTNGIPCSVQAGILATPGVNPGDFTISDNSTNATVSSFEYWNGTSNITTPILPAASVNINFPNNGNYPYIYTVINASGNCMDSIVGSISVSNYPYPCSTLQAGLTIVQGTIPGEFTFTDNSTSGDLSYLYPGFGGVLNLLPSQSITVTYPANGSYNYNYFLSDTATGCSDTIFGTILVTGIITSNPCQANFTLLQDSLNTSQYYCWNTATNSTGTTAGLSYSWDFGDGNTSTLAYPIHTYNSLGSFALCLTITDLSGCTSTYCDTIQVTVKASGTTINVLPAGTNLGLEETTTISSVLISPNPSNGQFVINLDAKSATVLDFSIINLSGQTLHQNVAQLSEGANTIQIDQTNLAKGVYLLNITDRQTKGSEMIRFVIK